MTTAWCSYGSIVAGLLGAVFIMIGVSALAHPWSNGYVSEAGATTSGHHSIYRVGIALVAISIGLLGAALIADPAPPAHRWWPRWIPAAWTLLAIGAVLGSVSSRVSCTTGCPLPPYETTTAQDMVHAVTSIGAVGFGTLAMLAIAVTYPAGAVRRLARVGAAVCVPPLVFLAVAILAIGRGPVTGITERAALALVLAWMTATAAVVARR